MVGGRRFICSRVPIMFGIWLAGGVLFAHAYLLSQVSALYDQDDYQQVGTATGESDSDVY